MLRLDAAALALLAALALAACSGGTSCDRLAKKLCEGKDGPACTRTHAWLDSELTGPDDKALSASDKGQACTMILDDEQVLAAYLREADKQLAEAQ
jgi:hypothetical protein